MLSQVSFHVPQALKKKFTSKAKGEGVSQRALFTAFIKAYLKGQVSFGLEFGEIGKQDEEIEIIDPLEVPEDTQEIMNKLADISFKSSPEQPLRQSHA